MLTTEQARAAGASVILGALGDSYGSLIHEPDLSHSVRNQSMTNSSPDCTNTLVGHSREKHVIGNRRSRRSRAHSRKAPAYNCSFGFLREAQSQYIEMGEVCTARIRPAGRLLGIHGKRIAGGARQTLYPESA